jgi:hypothetical protein
MGISLTAMTGNVGAASVTVVHYDDPIVNEIRVEYGSTTEICSGPISWTCTYNGIPIGETVTVTAISGPGYEFTQWLDDLIGESQNPFTFTLDTTTRTVGADFVGAITHTLTVTKSSVGGGAGAVNSNPAGISCGGDCSQDYPQNTTVTLNASPDSGTIFTGWYDKDTTALLSTNLSYDVLMDALKNIEAQFTQTYVLTLNASGSGSGIVAADQTDAVAPDTYLAGTVVQITATPAADAVFENWTLNAGAGPIFDTTAATTTVTMNSDNTVTADFTQTYQLTLNTSGSGSGIAAADQTDAVALNTYRVGTVVHRQPMQYLKTGRWMPAQDPFSTRRPPPPP